MARFNDKIVATKIKPYLANGEQLKHWATGFTLGSLAPLLLMLIPALLWMPFAIMAGAGLMSSLMSQYGGLGAI